MLAVASIGGITTILTALVIIWWNIPLHDVAIDTNPLNNGTIKSVKDPLNPVSLTRSIVGQLFLIMASFSYAYFSTTVISCIIWYHWYSKQKKILNSSTLLKIVSGFNPITWIISLKVLGWMALFHGIAIILTIIAPVLLHTCVGYTQSKITMNHTAIAVVPDAPFKGLPATLHPYMGDLNGSSIQIQAVSEMVNSIFIGYNTDLDFFAKLTVSPYIQQYINGQEHDYNFFTTIPVVNSINGYFALHTNSTYEILNTTHIQYNINTDDGPFCSIVRPIPTVIPVWPWIGCTTDDNANHIFNVKPPKTLPVPQSGYLDITDGSGNLTTLGITYNIKYRCYAVSNSPPATYCEDPALSTNSTLAFTDTLTPILNVLNSATYNPNLTSSVPLAFIGALHINSSATTIEWDEKYTNAGNLFLTYILWAINYTGYNGDDSQIVTPYRYEYYTVGKVGNLWFLICLIPIFITSISCYAIRKAPKKVVTEIVTSYWLLNVILQGSKSHKLIEDGKASDEYWTSEDFLFVNDSNNYNNINNINLNVEDEKLLEREL